MPKRIPRPIEGGFAKLAYFSKGGMDHSDPGIALPPMLQMLEMQLGRDTLQAGLYDALQRLTQLKRLDVSNVICPDLSPANRNKLPASLATLSLKGRHVARDDWKHLARLKNLRQLVVAPPHAEAYDADAMRSLKQCNPRLEVLMPGLLVC